MEDQRGHAVVGGLDNEANTASYLGSKDSNSCNYLSAGLAGSTGSSQLWTETTPSPGYAASSGGVTITKPDRSGERVASTWDTKCDDAQGAPLVRGKTFADATADYTGGTGTVNLLTGAVNISWKGSFTVVFYGGMTYWSVTDPQLRLDGDGTGQLTGTVSGYGADMNDSTKWTRLDPTDIVLADFTGVDVQAALDGLGFSATPEFDTVTAQTANGQVTGSWPQSFVDFQAKTGQSSYWYASGSSDDLKKPLPFSVGYLPTSAPAVASGGTAVADPRRARDTGLRISLGVGSLGAAVAAPIGAGFLIRRRLGLDPTSIP